MFTLLCGVTKDFIIQPFEAPQRSFCSSGRRRVEELKVFGRKYLAEKLKYIFFMTEFEPTISSLQFLDHRRLLCPSRS